MDVKFNIYVKISIDCLVRHDYITFHVQCFRPESNFLEKPFADNELLQSINEAMAISRKLKTEKEEIQTTYKKIRNAVVNKVRQDTL